MSSFIFLATNDKVDKALVLSKADLIGLSLFDLTQDTSNSDWYSEISSNTIRINGKIYDFIVDVCDDFEESTKSEKFLQFLQEMLMLSTKVLIVPFHSEKNEGFNIKTAVITKKIKDVKVEDFLTIPLNHALQIEK